MTLESSKYLGGIGAILVLIAIPFALVHSTLASLVGFIGMILVLVALHGLSGVYGERGIFTNALYAFVISIVGVIVTGLTAVLAVLADLSSIKDFLYVLFPNWDGNLSSLAGMTPNTSNLDPTALLPYMFSILIIVVVVIVVIWIFAIVSMFFLKRSLGIVAEKSNYGLFGTAGLILLIGAFLIIALVLPGIIVLWIGALVLAVAFFQVKPPQPQQQAAATMVPPPQSAPV